MFAASTKRGGQTLAFPDVCLTPPRPPAGPVPIPYPDSQLQENLREANAADAKAKSGNKAATQAKEKAIMQLKDQTGLEASSATTAVLLGFGAMKKAAGDESGASKGVSTSKVTGQKLRSISGVSYIGAAASGSQFNIAPSQTKVYVSP